MTDIVLALGSNLGDRLAHLRAGLERIRGFVEVRAVSSVVECPPREVEEGPEQPDYLNAVVVGRTEMGPEELLAACLEVEAAAGRTRRYPRAPRTLDVDVVLYGDRVIDRPGLTVPHPRWRERDFVLVPLLEVAPARVDPESGRTVEEIARERGATPGQLPRVADPETFSRP